MNSRLQFIVHRSSFIVLAVLACAQPQQPPREIQRVVSLAPNVTEIIAAAGCREKIAGTDNFSDYPEAVKSLPKVGGVEPDVEKIAALRPDLVVASASNVHPNLRRALDAVHLPLLVVRTDRLASIARAVNDVGRALGCPSTRQAIVMITTALQRQRRTRPRAPRVLFAVWTDPLYVAGRETFIDDLLALTGARNAIDAAGWPQISLEVLAAHPPDLILYPDRSVSAAAVADLLHRAGLAPVWERPPSAAPRRAKAPAATLVQAVPVDEDVFTHPGPRVTVAAAELNRILDQWERSH